MRTKKVLTCKRCQESIIWIGVERNHITFIINRAYLKCNTFLKIMKIARYHKNNRAIVDGILFIHFLYYRINVRP